MNHRSPSMPLRFALAGVFTLVAACNKSAVEYVDRGKSLEKSGNYAEAELNYRKALQKDTNLAEAYQRMGHIEERKANPRGAFQMYSRAVELAPANREFRKDLSASALTFYLQGRQKVFYDKLTALSAVFLSEDAKSFDGLRLKAYLLATDGKLDEAIATARQAIESRPKDIEMRAALANLQLQAGRIADGERTANELIASEPSRGEGYDALYQFYFNSGKHPQAEEVLKRRIAANPAHGALLMPLASHYLMTRQDAKVKEILGAVSDTSKYPGGLLLAGDFLAQAGDRAGAERHYQQGLANDKPRLIEYKKRLLAVRVDANQYDEARKLVDEILAAKPDDETTLYSKALLALMDGKPAQLEEAIQGFKKVLLKSPPREHVVHFQLGLAYRAKGRREEARAEFLTAAARSRTYLAPRYVLAEMALEDGRFAAAVEQINSVIAVDPNSYQAKLLRVRAMRGSKRFVEARNELNAMLKQTGADGRGHALAELELGLLSIDENRLHEAEGIFRRYHAMKPPDPRAVAGLIQVYSAQGKYDQAIELIRAELAKAPNAVLLQSALADSLARKGDLAGAAAQYRQIIASHPKDPNGYLRLAGVLHAQGNTNDAQIEVLKAIEARPNNPEALALSASLHATAGQYPQAKTQIQRVLELNPGSASVLNNAAWIHAQTGDLDDALRFAQQALRAQPNDHHVLDTLAYIYLKQKRSDAALQIYQRLVTNAKDNPTFRYHFAMTLLDRGDRQRAAQELQAALKLNPSASQVKEIKELLQRVG